MKRVEGIYVRFGDSIDPEANQRVHALARALEAEPLPGVTEIVPSYTSVFVEYDRLALSQRRVRSWIRSVEPQVNWGSKRTVAVGVRYDGRDLEAVAAAAGIEVEELVRRHSEVEYRVYAIGFTPGFPFMGAVDPLIRLPRLEVPRARVEAHTVAMADAQTGIYPLPSPGGWHQLGTAQEAVYDPHRKEPFLLEPGDTVRLVQVGAASGAMAGTRNLAVETQAPGPAAPEPLELLPREPVRPVLAVREAGLLDLIVDAGRYGVARLGLARSGPLDVRSAALANGLVGNRPDTPLLEMNVKGPVLEAVSDCVVAFAGFGVLPVVNRTPAAPFTSFALRAGDRLAFPAQGRGARGYLALAGGIESGRFRESASVDVRGLIGRPLAADDVLGVDQPRRARPGFSFEPYRWSPTTRRFAAGGDGGPITTLRLRVGPQPDSAAMRALTTALFRVEHADRMGLQLDRGRASGRRPASGVPGHGIISEPNPLGAVQVTPSGRPLVLLHDRGTVGGYTKPAVLYPADLPTAGQLRTGDRVRFVLYR